MKVFIKGLNTCEMRKQNVSRYKEYLLANGHELVFSPEESERIIIWTCAFREDVRDNSISEVQRYQKEYNSEVIVAGCLPDIDPDLLGSNFNGRLINWRDEEQKIEEIWKPDNLKFNQISPVFIEEKKCDDVEKFKIENPGKQATFYDQFLKLVISEGCSFDCTYCSEKLMFPVFRSFPEEKLVEACSRMIEDTGEYRIALMADSLGDYGHDIGSNFPTLLKKLKAIHPNIQFVLFNYHPAHFIKFFDEMENFIKDEYFYHINLPIQSASNRILKLMKRLYSKEGLERLFGMMRHNSFDFYDTHILIGFPGETEKEFEETINFVIDNKIKYVLTNKCMLNRKMSAYQLSGRNDSDTMNRRIKIAEERMKQTGIIVNSDGGEHMKKRFKRLNQP